MAYAGARLVAAGFRSVGIEARPAPESNDETLELGGLHTSGEECLPHKITVGDFLKVCRQPGFDPAKTAFMMPTAQGPCRFGQYGPYLRQLLEEMGYDDVVIFSPTSRDGYAGFGDDAAELTRTMWMGVVAGDTVTRFLLKTRPYETTVGDADQVFHDSLADFEKVLSTTGLKPKQRLARLREAIVVMRDRFRAVPARYEKGRPLIGLVGEIFCRHNNFSNDETARRVEKFGGECWLSDIAEWVWYVNWYVDHVTLREKGRFSWTHLKNKLKTTLQRRYEEYLLEPVHADLRGYEEPHDVVDVLEAGRPYLRPEGCIGEMVLSVGKSIYLHGKGIDGIIDISPFTCMNGVICEAIYPSLSRDHDELPIRTCYFDGVNTNLDRDIEIFLDLARAYQRRKKIPRVYPDYFA